jgi:hypothetical protein
MGWPATGCRTFGKADFMRVPRPAASTTAAMLDAAKIYSASLAINHYGEDYKKKKINTTIMLTGTIY